MILVYQVSGMLAGWGGGVWGESWLWERGFDHIMVFLTLTLDQYILNWYRVGCKPAPRNALKRTIMILQQNGKSNIWSNVFLKIKGVCNFFDGLFAFIAIILTQIFVEPLVSGVCKSWNWKWKLETELETRSGHQQGNGCQIICASSLLAKYHAFICCDVIGRKFGSSPACNHSRPDLAVQLKERYCLGL